MAAQIYEFQFNDLQTLQKILGHDSSRMAPDAHLSKGHVAAEMQVFAAALPRSARDRFL